MKQLLFLLLLGVLVVHCNGSPGSSASRFVPDASTPDANDSVPPTFAGVQSAVATDETHVALTWSAATDNATPPAKLVYRIYASTTPGGALLSPAAVTPAGATGATVALLHAATTYYFVVHAVDAAGNEDSNRAEASATTTDHTAPEFAGVLAVRGADRDALLVSWSAAMDNGSAPSAITYAIYVGTTSGGEDFTMPAGTVVGGTQFTVRGLSEATRYFVVVRATDAAKNTDPNRREASGQTLDETPPTFSGAASATAQGTTITLTWPQASDNSDPPASIAYHVYVASAPGGETFATPTYSVGEGLTSYLDQHLDFSTAYYFVVRAVDTSGNEDQNVHEVSATTAAAADTAPPAFAGLTSATAQTDTTIALGWGMATDNQTAPADIAYDVYAAAMPGGELFSTPSYVAPSGAASFVVSGLTPGQTTYFVVRARDQAGNEDKNTVELSATTKADLIPPAFAGLVTATATGPTAISLGWQAASDDATTASAIVYQVFEGTSAGAEGAAPIATTAAGATAFVVNGLLPKTAYFFYIRAVDGSGNADKSSPTVERAATTPADTTPPQFGGVTALVSTSPTTLTATWDPAQDDVSPSSGITYLAYLATTAGGETYATATMSVGAGATTLTFTGLTPNTTYFVVLRAEDAAGNIDTNSVEKSAPTEADTTAPAFAGATGVSAAKPNSLTVNWTAASDLVTAPSAIDYLVCVSGMPSGCSGSAFTTTATVTGSLSFVATNLSPATAYYFVVRAEDAAGNIDGNDIQVAGQTAPTVPVPDTTPPSFAGLTSAGTPTPTTLVLTWPLATDDQSTQTQLSFNVYQSTGAGHESFASATVVGISQVAGPGPNAFTVTGLSPSTQYCFVVRASDAAGNQETNVVEQCGTTAALPKPTFVSQSVLSSSFASFTLTWSATVTPASPITYRVCYATATGVCPAAGTTVTASAPPATISVGIAPSHTAATYFFVIEATDASGTTDSAEISGMTTPDTTAPAAPKALALTASAATPTVLGASVTEPNPGDNASPQANLGYDFCWNTTGASCTTAMQSIAPGPGAATSANLAVGLSNTAFDVFVRAVDEAHNVSSWLGPVVQTTAVSCTTDINPIFASSCNLSACHATPTSIMPGPFTCSFFAANPSPAALCTGDAYFNAGATSTASAGLIYAVSSGGTVCGTTDVQMPPGGTLSTGNLATLLSWVGQGALTNH